jgi:hypothetical protein
MTPLEKSRTLSETPIMNPQVIVAWLRDEVLETF